MTRDEKHIIVTAKFKCKSGRSDKIGIIDVMGKDDFRIRMSTVLAPAMGDQRTRCFTITEELSDDMIELLISGFIRKYKLEISKDVVDIICMFSDAALLHCIRIGRDVDYHLVIPLQQAFKS